MMHRIYRIFKQWTFRFNIVYRSMIKKDFYKKRVKELKKRLIPAKAVLIVTHDYPDPDCIASAYGLQQLLTFWGVETIQIAFGGFVGRAENRALIRLLNIQTVPLSLVEYADFDRIILVDSFPGDGNVSLKKDYPIDIVIDHHPHTMSPNTSFYSDIQQNLGSTSTIIALYLLAEKCPITTSVATALFYGIKTDTRDMAQRVSSDDLECYKYLFDRIDHHILSKIESPDRDAEYFRVLYSAVASMAVYESLGHTHIGYISSPDYIAEIADLFHSLENLEWMICSGIFKNQIFFSIRSRMLETAGKNAETIAKQLKGDGGGHSTMAAGRIPLNGVPHQQAVGQFVQTIKEVFNIQTVDGQKILEFA